MGILDTLLSLLGLGGSSSSDERRETTVSVERDRAETDSEAAVKGTEADDDAAGTEAAASTDSLVDDDADAAEPAEAAGPDASDTETELDTATAESDGETTAEHDEGSEAAAESVDAIKGIGPAYAERLSAAGVESVADLAAADAEELAPKVDLSAKRVGRWIDRAKDR